jgi:hypothetical protein
VILLGKKKNGGHAPLPLSTDGTTLLVEAKGTPPVPSRTPLIATLVVTSTRKQLTEAGGDALLASDAGWLIDVPSGGASVRVGGVGVTAGAGGYVAAAGSDRAIPSSTLEGFHAISTGADVTITLIGAKHT